jgi:hypothetical protein
MLMDETSPRGEVHGAALQLTVTIRDAREGKKVVFA